MALINWNRYFFEIKKIWFFTLEKYLCYQSLAKALFLDKFLENRAIICVLQNHVDVLFVVEISVHIQNMLMSNYSLNIQVPLLIFFTLNESEFQFLFEVASPCCILWSPPLIIFWDLLQAAILCLLLYTQGQICLFPGNLQQQNRQLSIAFRPFWKLNVEASEKFIEYWTWEMGEDFPYSKWICFLLCFTYFKS